MGLADHTCDTCGVTLMDGAEGLLSCPRCQVELVSGDAHSISLHETPRDGSEALAQRIEIPPEVIARYALGRVLGRGGMGMVVAAIEKETKQAVAIKFLTRLDDDAALARFLQEGELLRGIRHPNVLPVRELGAIGQCPWLVCELLTGGNLRQHLDREGRLAPRAAVGIACGVLAGLAALHDRGIVHRDLKPQNILFDQSGRPHIADLGLAKLWGPDQQHLTKTGALLGTPKYMAPEQANGEPAGTPADIYATALVLYEMLAGRPPFEDSSIFVLLMEQIQSAPPPLKENAPDIPDALHDAVHRALAKAPAERQETATQFAAELKRAIEPKRAGRTGLSRAAGKSGAAVNVPDKPVAAPSISVPAPSTRPLTFAAVATGLLLVGLSVALVGPRGPDVPPASPSVSVGARSPGNPPPATRAPVAVARPSPSTVQRAPPLVVRRPALVVPAASAGPWLTTTAAPRILWRLPAERCQHPAPLGALAVVDGQTISASPDGLIAFWDATGVRRRILRLRFGAPVALALAAYRATCATAYDDGTVRVWDLSTDPPRPVLEQSGLHARALALSGKGNRLAVLRTDGTVTLVEPGQAPRTLREAAGAVRMVFTRSGEQLVTRDRSAALKVWQVGTGALARLISTEVDGDGPLWASEDRVLLLLNGGVHTWSLSSGERLASGWSPGEGTTTLGLTADGATLYACTAESLRRFDVASGAPQDPLEGAVARAHLLAISEDGKLVATGAPDGALALGDARKSLAAGPQLLGLRQRIGLSADGRTLALATSRTLSTCDLATHTFASGPALFAGEAEASLAPVALAVANGARVISAAAGARVVRRELSGGQDRFITPLAVERIEALAATADGRGLAVAGGGTLVVWPDFAAGGDPLTAHTPQGQQVLALAFDPAGARVGAAGGPTGFLELFEARTGKMIVRFGAGELVRHAALDPTLGGAAVDTLDSVEIYGLGTGAKLARTAAQPIDRGALALLAPEGPVLWSDTHGDLQRFRPSTGLEPKLDGLIGVITQLSWSTDGRVLAALASDGTLTVWQLK